MIQKKIIFLIFIICVNFGCGARLYKSSEFIMGTFVEVVSYDQTAGKIVFDEFKRLESVFNLFDEDSELYHLNQKGEMVVSEDLFAILKKSREFYDMTGGAFDVTVAPVSLLWKKAIDESVLPAPESINEALQFVGFNGIYLDEESRRVKFLVLGIKIDLGAVAKGYAVDSAVLKLKDAGVTSAIVNAGGNIFCVGSNKGKAWLVGIQDPRLSRKLAGKIELEDKAVATSGDYEQFFVFKNKRYSHIIDPSTGYPADSGIISVTVVASDATTADALSTSIIVLGKQKGKELMTKFSGASAEFVDDQDRLYEL